MVVVAASRGDEQDTALRLEPLTTAGADAIEGWFDHPEVRRRLGGREWIHREVRLIEQRPGEEFRGMVTLRDYGWVVVDQHDRLVAFAGGSIYDRWLHFPTQDATEPDLVDERRSMGLTYVVDPARWGQGCGRRALRAVTAHPGVADVEVFYCGIDADNLASRRSCLAAGFAVVDPVPDWENTLYFRRARTSSSWSGSPTSDANRPDR